MGTVNRPDRPTGDQEDPSRSSPARGFCLARLLVGRMLAAVPAEFPVLHAPRLLLLVLRGGIVPSLAIAAFQRNDISHGVALQFCETIVHSCRACDRD